MSKKPLPWWLEAGPENCPFCAGRVHFEALAYCADCDRPVCPTCLVPADRALCPECAEAGAV